MIQKEIKFKAHTKNPFSAKSGVKISWRLIFTPQSATPLPR